ncbi:MAG: acyl-CoA/acyl-ACP dehydrogenase [Fimbriimonas sp.]|nr:acyl-CoA/acyl-ACP dehydrogenase [Fimbriimonas sp.]
MMREVEVLEEAKRFLKEEVAPVAEIIDRDVDALRRIVDRMGECGLLALKRPEKFGGPGMSDPLFRAFQEEVARVSGTLAFLTTQHQSAVAMIAAGSNEALKQTYLPLMADGTRLVGIGFSQLRRGGPPIMRATRVDGGYLLDGHVPWITGWSFYPEFMLGATLPDSQSLFVIAPLIDIDQEIPQYSGVFKPTSDDQSTFGRIRVSPPMQLAAMGAAMTVTAEFTNYFASDDKVAFIKPAGWIQNNDMINIALQGHFAIGCAMAGIDVVRRNAQSKPFCFLPDAVTSFESELAALRMATAQAQKTAGEETTPARLEVRAWAIDFSVRCAHAAIASSSGASNSIDHPAQRIYREALVYTVSAQTPAIMEATLNRLVARRT